MRDIKNPFIDLFETIKRRLPLRSKPQIHFCPTIFGEAIFRACKNRKIRLDNFHERRKLSFVKSPKPRTFKADASPDISRCRVRRSDIAGLVCCCSEVDASDCEYAERRAFDTFCLHPQWREILARSEARR